MSALAESVCQRSFSTPSSSGREALQRAGPQLVYRSQKFCGRRRRRALVRAFLTDQQVPGARLQSSSSSPLWKVPLLAGVVSAVEATSLIAPPPSSAGETLSVEFLSSFLDNVASLGPYGPLFFVAVMISAEMVPLFPTQPLTIASGLLFGGPKGALLAVAGTSSAAILAFQLSRKLGKKMAEKAAAEEMSEEQQQSGILNRVQNAIESGSVQEQVVAVTLLRLTPVIPFSATNYLLGATPLKFPAYVAGSLAGLTFWCSIYAALGAAGRELLRGGLSLDVLFEELLSRAGSYTEDAAIIMGVVGISIAIYTKFGPQAANSDDHPDEHEEKRT